MSLQTDATPQKSPQVPEADHRSLPRRAAVGANVCARARWSDLCGQVAGRQIGTRYRHGEPRRSARGSEASSPPD